MKHRLLILIALLGVGALLGGCNSGGEPVNDKPVGDIKPAGDGANKGSA